MTAWYRDADPLATGTWDAVPGGKAAEIKGPFSLKRAAGYRGLIAASFAS